MMAFGGCKGDLAVVIDSGMNRLDRAKVVSNVMRVRGKARCSFEQD